MTVYDMINERKELYSYDSYSFLFFSDNQVHKLWEKWFFKAPTPFPPPSPHNNVGKMDNTDPQHCYGGEGVPENTFMENSHKFLHLIV